MDVSAILQSPKLKVQRAYSHIDELRKLSSPLSKDLHSIQIEPRIIPPNMKAAGYGVSYHPLKPVPETFALIIGDAVHNLRGALDHLCTGIVRVRDPSAKEHFPMRKNRNDLTTVGKKGTPLDFMEKALPGSAKLLLDEIRPVNDPNNWIWAFHDLDNDDKHNLLIPTVTIAANRADRIKTITGQSIPTIRFGVDAAKPAKLFAVDVPFNVEGDIHTTVEVNFRNDTPFKNEPVIQTLTQIAQVVDKTLDAFAGLIVSVHGR